MIIKIVQGFCMAMADSVPGVSGGTVAFILGFYERFLNELHNLFGKEHAARKPAFLYLMKLGLGWCIGFVLSMLALSKLFDNHMYFLSSLFLGLTAASIPFIVVSEKETMARKYRNLLYTLLGIATVCGLTLFRVSSAGNGAINYLSLRPLQYIYLFAAGMLAVAAMVLPGISGSTLLLIFGVYVPTVSAVRQLLHWNPAVLPGLLSLGLGVLFGAATSVHLIRSALRRHRSRMLYLIIGLTAGSLYAIDMGPTTLSAPLSPLGLSSFRPIGFILGIAVLLGLEKLKQAANREETPGQAGASEASTQATHS